jgi:Flp pilus assembly protein TadD
MLMAPFRLVTAFAPTVGARRGFLILVSILLLVAMISVLLPRQAGVKAPPHRISGGPGKEAAHAETQRKAETKLRFEQGVAMLQMKEFQHAITAFHRVLELEPKLPEAHINMGFAFYELGDYPGAQRFFEGALALAPHLHNARYGLAISLQAKGDPAAAKIALQHYLAAVDADDPFRPKALLRLQEVEQALRQHPAQPGAQNVPTPLVPAKPAP